MLLFRHKSDPVTHAPNPQDGTGSQTHAACGLSRLRPAPRLLVPHLPPALPWTFPGKRVSGSPGAGVSSQEPAPSLCPPLPKPRPLDPPLPQQKNQTSPPRQPPTPPSSLARGPGPSQPQEPPPV
uniref:Uncharacterized protein n=1 Tax=Myotis myotis TaxID=51298 RepID=A0A7J7SCF6_MYOMY|nr:hypothetical protein mMyoMyo1_009554 [Myotis myotis]